MRYAGAHQTLPSGADGAIVIGSPEFTRRNFHVDCGICFTAYGSTRCATRGDKALPHRCFEQTALLAAMAYLHLNPIRAEIAKSIAGSRHTGVLTRHKAIRKNRSLADKH